MLPEAMLVGLMSLHACQRAPGYYCGTIARPLDSAGAVRGTIRVAFMWRPHSERTRSTQGTIVAAEGGPGYGSTGSRDAYAKMLGPLLRTRDLLLMDDRGTGGSAPIDCPALQSAAVMILRNVTSCGQMLGRTADLYGSAPAADDLDALLAALGVHSADFYGDSYGTFFVQVFAARHPNRVRSVVLDGAYPAIGGDPWYASTASEIGRAFDLACARSPACAALGETSLVRIERLLRRLRASGGTVTPSHIAFVAASAGLDSLAYRELDAAARAYFNGDTVPLRRLVAEAERYEEKAPASPATLSQGLFVASSCSDNPQAYDMRLQPSARQRAWQQILATQRRIAPDLYAPFKLDEFLGMPLDYAYVPLCQTWPVASPRHVAGQPVPPGIGMPRVPALVLTGDLDTVTTPAEGDAAAALFPGARRVIVTNTGHVTAIDDVDNCASVIVRSFIERRAFAASCARSIPAMHLVGSFAAGLGNVTPAVAAKGSAWKRRDLQVAAAAVQAAADAVARVETLGVSAGRGLRGGTFTSRTTGSSTVIALREVKWTSDLGVDGSVTVSTASRCRAVLRAGGLALNARWETRGSGAIATIETTAAQPLRATMPAP